MGDWDVTSETPDADAWAVVTQSPMYKGRPGVRAALKDLTQSPVQAALDRQHGTTRGQARSRDDLNTLSERYLNGATLGAFRQATAGVGAGITALQRAVPGGKNPAYTAKDMYDATRLLQNSKQERLAGQHPLVAAGTDVAGALMMPGAGQVGKFVVGKVAPRAYAAGRAVPAGERVLQGARLAATGGALTGVSAAALAPPGEAVERGTTGALTGAVLAPLAGAAAGTVAPLARAAGRTVARAVGRGPTPDITSLEKLQKALRQEGVLPDVIEAASARWREVGGVDPALIDLIKESGGSPAVLSLLSKSASKAPARKIAETYAEDTVGSVQKNALEQARALPTGGETRTPSQIRTDLAAEGAGIDADLTSRTREATRRGDVKATAIEQRGNRQVGQIGQTEAERLAQIEANRIAETPEVPGAPRPRETGAAVYADDMNRQYDISEKTYKDAYAAAEAAQPEAAIVDSAEVRPLFEKLKVPQTFDDALPGVAAVKKYLAGKKGAVAPGDMSDWPEGEAMDLAAPLTMLELQKMRQVLTHYASKYADEPGGALAGRLKGNLDTEIDRLAAENKISGDPAIVDKWKTAINGAREHFTKFGSGAAAKITARNPDGSRVVPNHQAGDVLFGAAPSQTSLNKSLTELSDSLALASPESRRALQEELYGRVKVSDLAKLRETTGGKLLLPDDLSTEAVAAQEAARAAEVKAASEAESTKATAQGLRESTTAGAEARRVQVDLNTTARQDRLAAEAAARKEPLAAREAALKLGEGALKTPTEEFGPALMDVQATDLPVTSVGARQAVLDTLERPPPNETGVLNRLLSTQATENLGRAVSPADVARMQARMTNIKQQAQTAQQLEQSLDASAVHNTPMIEQVTPGDLAYPTRGTADFGLKFWRMLGRLSHEEQTAALAALTSKDPEMKARLLDGLIRKYPKVKRAIAPLLVRPAAQQGDESAVDTLNEDYGLEVP